MGIIRQLPPAVINQIAAGEVVERPASVVKELLENAIDAAGHADRPVGRAGRQRPDPGRRQRPGNGPDDLVLAFQPHATSKLAEADDLFRIRTLGFRGEALAAIAEVAKLRCQTRQAGAAEGSELLIEGGIFSPVKNCGCPPGTRDGSPEPLLQHSRAPDVSQVGYDRERPCRRHVFTDRAGAPGDPPDLSLGDQGRLRPAPGRRARASGSRPFSAASWPSRCSGSRASSTTCSSGATSPTRRKAARRAKGQFLFIAGRYVRDRSLSHALNEAYRGLLMVGRMPVAFLHLDIPPEEVDVNVHPTKIEVRFRDSHRVYSHLLSTLRQTFLKSDLHSRLQAAQEAARRNQRLIGAGAGAISHAEHASVADSGFRQGVGVGRFDLAGGPDDRQTVASWFEPSGTRPVIPESIGQPIRHRGPNRFRWHFPSGPVEAFDEFSCGSGRCYVIARQSTRTVDSTANPRNGPSAERRPSEQPSRCAVRFFASRRTEADERLIDRTDSAVTTDSRARRIRMLLKAIQVHDSYLIAETGDGMMVIDQHALHERILYEELRSRSPRGESSRNGCWSPSRWT